LATLGIHHSNLPIVPAQPYHLLAGVTGERYYVLQMATVCFVLADFVAKHLHSVIGRSDLQNYVLKKKYHRLEYLQRLTATVGGIVIYNSDGPDGDRENVRSGKLKIFLNPYIRCFSDSEKFDFISFFSGQ